MVLTLAPFSGVNVTSKIALWEMRAQMQDSPAPMRAAKRLETSRIASSEEPQIGEICHARICYYVAETQEASPVVELAGFPPSVELATVSPVTRSKTVSLVSKPKTSSDCTSSLLELHFESAMSRLPFESATSRLPFESATSRPPFESMICSPSDEDEDATSPPSPSSATFSVPTETSEPLDELDLHGIETAFDSPVAAPLSGLLWRQ